MERSIVLIAHDIRSLWNVGSLFRTCDAMNVEKLWLTGYTGTPPRREIAKTALGADEWITWEHARDPLPVLDAYAQEGWTLTALEQTPKAVDVSVYSPPERIVLVLGHEVLGVPAAILDRCGDHIQIPMFGRKKSLNVTVAAGIALHKLRCAAV